MGTGARAGDAERAIRGSHRAAGDDLGETLNRVPPLTLVANDKLRFVVLFFAAAAAALTVDRISRGAVAWEIGGGVVITILAAYLFGQKRGVTLSVYAIVGVVALALFWISFAALRRLVSGQWVGWAAAAVTFVELSVFNLPFNAMAKRDYFVPRLPIIDKLHSIAPGEPFRILGFDWTLLPNNSVQYALEDIRGSDPMAWDPYMKFLQLIAVDDPAVNVKRVEDMTPPAIDFLNVQYVLTEPGMELDRSWRLRYRGPDGNLFENLEVLPRFFTPASLVPRSAAPPLEQLRQVNDFRQSVLVEDAGGGNSVIPSMWIRQMRPGRFRLTLDAPEPLFIASSQPASPGWKVRINGRPARIHHVNGAFIGFFVPAGNVKAVITYQPLSFYGSLAVSALTLIGFSMLMMFRRSGDESRGL